MELSGRMVGRVRGVGGAELVLEDVCEVARIRESRKWMWKWNVKGEERMWARKRGFVTK